MSLKSTKSSVTVNETKIFLDKEAILNLLKSAKIICDDVSDLEIRCFVRVPGGGDWSNTNLDLDTDTGVQVVFKSAVRS